MYIIIVGLNKIQVHMKFLCLLTVKIILRYHGRWILTKKWKKNIFPVQIEKTGINILQKNGKKAFLLFKIEEKNYF